MSFPFLLSKETLPEYSFTPQMWDLENIRCVQGTADTSYSMIEVRWKGLLSDQVTRAHFKTEKGRDAAFDILYREWLAVTTKVRTEYIPS